MSVTRDFDAALRSSDPLESLRSSVDRELRSGTSRDRVLSDLAELHAVLVRDGRDADDDVVLDVMDFVTGWCSPHMRL